MYMTAYGSHADSMSMRGSFSPCSHQHTHSASQRASQAESQIQRKEDWRQEWTRLAAELQEE
eukprot:1083498-Rhodomonas_salina.1